jgi:transposase
MAITDGAGLPLAITIASATPSEVTLVDETLKRRFLPQWLPRRLIGDCGYDSDRLDAHLAKRGIEVIAPHKSTRRNMTQDGRPLRRYRRRWKVERLFAWLQNFRRLVTRYERHAENFLAFVQLGCIIILSRQFVR